MHLIWRSLITRAVAESPHAHPNRQRSRANLYRLMDQTAESHEPVIISGQRSDAVLVSAEDWQAIQETLHLL